ncbi:MAG: glycosyltransferase [Deltaproteobacteria bacterium]|nr:glycosyltransferase [Deltaproteobacteria bacterium]
MNPVVHWLVVLAAVYWGIRLVVAAARAAGNTFHVTPDTPVDVASDVTVSVCIPARNEEGRVGLTITDVLAQEHPGLIEVIVLDDGSEDGTAAEIDAAAGGDPRVRRIGGSGPPPGWKGKQAAVWRAQKEASGQWLLFVDADVRLHPKALGVALSEAQRRDAGMVSWLGQLSTVTFWEHVLMPFIGDLILLFTKPKFVNDPTRDDCLANGQFILIRRDAYDLVGGHEAVKDSVIDDVSLAREVKFHAPGGFPRYVLLTSTGLMQVRMYEDLRGIWDGWTKNFFAASKNSVGSMLFLAGYLLWTSVLPFVALPLAVVGGFDATLPWAAASVALTLTYRVAMLRLMPHPAWAVLLHPLAAFVTAGIVTDSMLRGTGVRKPVKWKGREV